MSRARRIRLAKNDTDRLDQFLKGYRYQPALTRRLDNLPNKPILQETVNEIVLWKVNRYVELSRDVRQALHRLRQLRPMERRQAERVLLRLLRCDGVDLPKTSTFLRFENPEVFQIIDRHAYRAVFGEAYPLYSATPIATRRRFTSRISTHCRAVRCVGP